MDTNLLLYAHSRRKTALEWPLQPRSGHTNFGLSAPRETKPRVRPENHEVRTTTRKNPNKTNYSCVVSSLLFPSRFSLWFPSLQKLFACACVRVRSCPETKTSASSYNSSSCEEHHGCFHSCPTFYTCSVPAPLLSQAREPERRF